MEQLVKNVPYAQPFTLAEQVDYESGQIVSLTLAQKPGVGMTLFAFDAGEGVSTHAAPGDAMVCVLEGEAKITIDGTVHQVGAGGAVVMPANVPHAVEAVTPFKMLLTVVNPVQQAEH